MRTTNQNDAFNNAYDQSNWFKHYPNGPYWIIPNLDWPYYPQLPKSEPIKIYNSDTSLSIKNESIVRPEVNILVNNNRQKIFKTNLNNNVYLNEGEFALELINKSSNILGAKIKIANQYISTSHLIVYPGQRIVLDRYLDTKSKFNFVIYSVEKNNSTIEQAIINNGLLEIEFYTENNDYHQSHRKHNFYDTSNNSNVIYGYNGAINSINNVTSLSDVFAANSSIHETNYTNLNIANVKDVKDTGLIDQGLESNQELTIVNKTFSNFCFFTFKVKLLPFSEKPIETKDLIKYCIKCGVKVNKQHCYCNQCGTKL